MWNLSVSSIVSMRFTLQYSPRYSNGASAAHSFRMMSSASRVIFRFWPLVPSMLNSFQSLGSPLDPTPNMKRPFCDVVEVGDPAGEFGRMMVGEQMGAGSQF